MANHADFALRPMGPGDAEMVRGWRNSERVRANMYTDAHIPADAHRRWLEGVLGAETCVYLVFERLGRPHGLVYFTGIDRAAGRAELGYYLGDGPAPPGLGGYLEFFALEHAFEVLGLRKLCAEVLAFNRAVLAVHDRFGLNREGLLVEHVLKNGELVDVVLLSMFRRQWESVGETMRRLLFRGAGR